MNFKLSFLGGVGTVTGSKTLLETPSGRILIDCGLFQGLRELRNLNRIPFIIPPESIDAIILTHAHLDHCGYIPLLVKKGFKGEIHCTDPTLDLTQIILTDSAKIMEEDAERATSHHYTKHVVAEPLYNRKDVQKAMELFVPHGFSEWVILNNDVKFEFLNNGHILGSAFVNMRVNDKKIVFSGDIGQMKPVLMYPPKKIEEADYIIMESTYGDRLHSEEDPKLQLLEAIQSTYEKGGVLMIPSFAVERTQEILYFLYLLRKEDLLPNMPVYLDSPMGIDSTRVYNMYREHQNISRYDLENMYEHVKFIDDAELSKNICLDGKTKIVLAGSGMIEGGRIIHYLNNHIDNKRNTLLFVGYQGEGTRGRAILSGAGEIKFFGEYHTVKCDIKYITSLSAHGDQKDIIEWLSNFKTKPEKVFLNHGEPHELDALRLKIESTFGWNVTIPSMYTEYSLS